MREGFHGMELLHPGFQPTLRTTSRSHRLVRQQRNATVMRQPTRSRLSRPTFVHETLLPQFLPAEFSACPQFARFAERCFGGFHSASWQSASLDSLRSPKHLQSPGSPHRQTLQRSNRAELTERTNSQRFSSVCRSWILRKFPDREAAKAFTSNLRVGPISRAIFIHEVSLSP
jgi:hypothetical protein